MKNKIHLVLLILTLPLLCSTSFAQIDRTDNENTKESVEFTLENYEGDEKIVNFIPIDRGIYRVELVNPMGIKSSELLANVEMDKGQKKSWILDDKTFNKSGMWYLLLYKNGRLKKSLSHRIVPEMSKM